MNSAVTTTDQYLADLPEWQKINLETLRRLIHEVEPTTTEEIKWGVPVFIYKSKVVFSMGSFKKHVKYNFILNGALLDDSGSLFNNGFESKKSRAIDLEEGKEISLPQLKVLVKKAIALVV